MKSPMTLTDTVGEWVTSHLSTSRVFERLNIDYCCGGGRPLEDACREASVDAQSILSDLSAVVSQDAHETNDDFISRSLAEMCDAIEATHHEYLRRELPRLSQLVQKVVSVHGEQHPWLSRLAESYRQLRGELESHMMKEERILFPAIRTIEQTRRVPDFPFGSVDNPIRMMEHEHDVAGQALRDIRAASSNYTVPEGGCNTFRAMLDGLRELGLELH